MIVLGERKPWIQLMIWFFKFRHYQVNDVINQKIAINLEKVLRNMRGYQ